MDRLIGAVIMQAILDLRIPGCRKEIDEFFHGPFIGACGIDGDYLLSMSDKVIGGRTWSQHLSY